MPSPFPGMNPYLEHRAVWHDFHERMCAAIATALMQQIRPNYFVRINEHVYFHELSANERLIAGRRETKVRHTTQTQRANDVAVVDPPSRVRLHAVDVDRQSFLEVINCEDERVVTVIEVLIPSIKRRGADREQYVAQRFKLLRNWVNFVEIDLLRGGPRMPMELLPACDYCVLVSRWRERPDAGVWPVQLHDPLPVIPIPLEPPHADAKLDLQAVLNRVYDEADAVTGEFINDAVHGREIDV